MPEVSVNSSIVIQAKKLCLSAEKEMKDAISSLNKELASISSEWEDKKAKEFEGIVNQCVTSLKRPLNDLHRCGDYLQKIENVLEEYDSISFGATHNSGSTQSTEDATIDNLTIINSHLAGENHPESGVPYIQRSFTVNGNQVEGGFPLFESKFEATLPEGMYTASDDAQFKECTRQLAEEIEKNPGLAQNFSQRQLAQIRDGASRIAGLTWHHREYPPGSMQLVNAEQHATSRHTGGRAVWGGGRDCR